MRNKLIVTVVMIAVAISASIVLAQAPTGQRPACDMMGPGAFARELNLTPDQIKQLQALHAEFMQATQGIRQQLAANMKETALLLADPNSSAADVKAKAAEGDQYRDQLRDAAIDHMICARAVLTPAQLEKLRTMIQNKPNFGMGMCWGTGEMQCPCGVGLGAGRPKGPAATCPR